MQVLNLVRPEKSDIKFEIITFPDGESHIKLEGIDRKDKVIVVCRITSPYDEVHFTNSYADWDEYMKLPDNVRIIKVI